MEAVNRKRDAKDIASEKVPQLFFSTNFMEKYRQVRVLGEGSFGQAWLVTHQSTSESLVIKTISIPAMTARDKQAAINEVKILSTLRHKNIILYKDAFVDQKNLCLVMEYADDGEFQR